MDTNTQSLMSPAEVAKMTGLTTGALAQMRYMGRGPGYFRLSPRTIRYERQTVLEWLEASRENMDAPRANPVLP